MFSAFRLSEPSSTFVVDLDSRAVHLDSPHTRISTILYENGLNFSQALCRRYFLTSAKSITKEESSMEMPVKRFLRIEFPFPL